MDTDPDTAMWRDLQRRLKDPAGDSSEIPLTSEAVASFIACGEETDAIR